MSCMKSLIYDEQLEIFDFIEWYVRNRWMTSNGGGWPMVWIGCWPGGRECTVPPTIYDFELLIGLFQYWISNWLEIVGFKTCHNIVTENIPNTKPTYVALGWDPQGMSFVCISRKDTKSYLVRLRVDTLNDSVATCLNF